MDPIMTKVPREKRMAIDALAVAEGQSRSACVRALLDLGLDQRLGALAATDPERYARFAEAMNGHA
jgi:hypothetical protein